MQAEIRSRALGKAGEVCGAARVINSGPLNRSAAFLRKRVIAANRAQLGRRVADEDVGQARASRTGSSRRGHDPREVANAQGGGTARGRERLPIATVARRAA